MDSVALLVRARGLLKSARCHMKMESLDPLQVLDCLKRAEDLIRTCIVLTSEGDPPHEFGECCRKLWGDEVGPGQIHQWWKKETGQLWRAAQLALLDREPK